MRRNWLLSPVTATALGSLTLAAVAHNFERVETHGGMSERGEHGRS